MLNQPVEVACTKPSQFADAIDSCMSEFINIKTIHVLIDSNSVNSKVLCVYQTVNFEKNYISKLTTM